jgi:WD40 repeat protein
LKPRVQIALDGDIADLAFSADGKLLASATSNPDADSPACRLRLWECATGRLVADLTPDDEFRVCALAFSPDGRRIAALCVNGVCSTWSVATGAQESHARLDSIADGGLYDACLGFGADGRLYVARTTILDNEPSSWDGVTGRGLQAKPPAGEVKFRKGTTVGVWAWGERRLDVYDFAAGRCLASLPFYDGRPNAPTYLCSTDFAPAAGTFACTTPGGKTIVVRDVASGQELAIDTADQTAFERTVSVSADGGLLALGPFLPPSSIAQDVRSLSEWAPDCLADKLSLTEEFEVRVYDAKNGRQVIRLPGLRAVFSPDGNTLLVVVSNEYSPDSVFILDRLNLYDVPFRGPLLLPLALGALCGGLTLALTRRSYTAAAAS